jgi:hypothetical protein
MALPGIGPLQESLTETNRLLEAVLAELRSTNSDRLDAIADQLRDLNSRLGGSVT